MVILDLVLKLRRLHMYLQTLACD